MVIPSLVLVVNNGSSKTASRVDAGAGDGNGGQVDHEHSETDWEWCQYLLELKIVHIKLLLPMELYLRKTQIKLNRFVLKN